MKQIGIKLADGSFYPIMEEGQPVKKTLGLTTVNDNQTRVLVDVYRSKTGTMEDAEYIDTLQIDNLVKHPNGQNEINLDIGLDENNKLIAEMKDPETGATSSANVTLVSRTLEERLEPTNYDVKLGEDGPVPVSDSEEIIPDADSENDGTEGSSVAAGVVAGAALGGLAAAAVMASKNGDEKSSEENVSEIAADDFELPDFGEENTAETSDSGESLSDTDLPDFGETSPLEESITEPEAPDAGESLANDEFDLPDFGEETAVPEEEISVPVTDDAVPAADSASASDFDLPDFGEENTEESAEASASDGIADGLGDAASDETVSETSLPDFGDENAFESTETPASAESTDSADFAGTDDSSVTDFDLPDFGEENTTESAEASASDETVTEVSDADEPAVEESLTDDMFAEDPSQDTVTADDTASIDDFDLPDFGEENTTESAEESVPSDETVTDTAFADDFASDTTETEDNSGSVAAGVAAGAALGGLAAAAAMSKDDDKTEVNEEDAFFNSISDTPEDDFSSNLVKDNTPSNGINFDGLYDKETVEGERNSDEIAEDVKKKTRTPVIICIICAIICVLATLLILFVVPSKYNLLGKSQKTETTVAETVKEEPVKEPEVIPAKENEVVVAEPEKVIPQPPKEPENKPKDIRYKIKWGDTLWDIADAYYKNPWNYKKIARYNNIQNPDHIISGTYITIPAK